MRTFVALNLSPETRAAIHAATEPLRAAGDRGVSWTRASALHLTLKFLGERSDDFVQRLAVELAPRVGRLAPVSVEIGRIGWFRSLAQLRVLWIGVGANAALSALYDEVELACLVLRVARERRPFHPHITLGRVREGAPLDRAVVQREAMSMHLRRQERVGTVDVMESVLGQGGSRYRVAHAVPIGDRNSEG